MNVEIISHKGKDIVLVDYKNIAEDQMLEVLKEGTSVVYERGKGGEKVLTLINMENTRIGLTFINESKEYTMPCLPYVKKAAMIGLTGLKGTMLDIYNRWVPKGGIKRFATKEEALDWLVK